MLRNVIFMRPRAKMKQKDMKDLKMVSKRSGNEHKEQMCEKCPATNTFCDPLFYMMGNQIQRHFAVTQGHGSGSCVPFQSGKKKWGRK